MLACGAYGKMPSLGDFFRIDLPRSFCAPWDAWVQSVLTSSRNALGAAWQERYMSAPIWRFSLGPGLAGPLPARGVLMPSVDRVGRAFPLTLISARADFAALEDLALAALEDDMTKERLRMALETLPEDTAVERPPKGAQWSALVGPEMQRFASAGLPEGADALRLIDPHASEVRA